MSEYAKNIQTIDDLWRKRIELREGNGGRMSEYIYYSDGKPLANEHREISLAREEIVRCRDCKYYGCYDGSTWCSRTYEQVPSGTCDYQTVESNGFCAWAERREP